MAITRSTRAGFAPTDAPIHALGTTSDCLTGRGGLVLFSRYLTSVGILPELVRLFGPIRRSRKGLPVASLFRQLFCFLIDGTDRHLTSFDRLKEDTGYAAAVETRTEAMASSHTVKRFFAGFSGQRTWLFRKVLQQLFLWRLHKEQPTEIVLGIDTMIMDNSEADVRHGVEPTYKKGIKGFQPLQVTWGRYMVDAVFRGGSKHSNHGDTVLKTIQYLVRLIRTRYRDVPIVIRMDSGFFDEAIMRHLEAFSVGYLLGGRLYPEIVKQADEAIDGSWFEVREGKRLWQVLEMWDKRGAWKSGYRRAIFSRLVVEANGQRVFSFADPSIVYTNLDPQTGFGRRLQAEGLASWLDVSTILRLYHGRGRDELANRALKEFAPENLPFRRFTANAALYYTTLVAFFLYEAFKQDVCEGVVDVTSYPTRLRRKVIDIAAKIVRTGGRTVIKVTEEIHKALAFETLWHRSARAPAFVWR